MRELSGTIASGMGHYFEDFRERVLRMASGLSETQYWTKPYAYGNSFGNLVQHLAGNLNYYIGDRIEGTGYVRNREAEFSSGLAIEKAQSLAEFEKAVSLVLESLKRQGVEDWSRSYEAKGVEDVPDRFSMYLRCCVHLHHHIGQMTYLVKEWVRQGEAG